MENKKKIEIYLEDNTDLIFGTECLYGNLDVKFRERLENDLFDKEIKEDDKKPNTL
jgi:hypothetical protein